MTIPEPGPRWGPIGFLDGAPRFPFALPAADAWGAAVDRSLQALNLTRAHPADCTTATTRSCFDSGTNDADAVALYLRQAAFGWTRVTGTAAVEVEP